MWQGSWQTREHPVKEYVVHRVHRDDKQQIFCLVKCDAKDDTSPDREEKLVDVAVDRVQGAEEHARDKDSHNCTASLNELRLQQDTKEQLLNERHKEDNNDAQPNELCRRSIWDKRVIPKNGVLDKPKPYANEGAKRNEVRQPEASREPKVVAAQLSVCNNRYDRDEHHAVNCLLY